MSGRRIDGPPTTLERASSASVAGMCGAIAAAGGAYALFYGLAAGAYAGAGAPAVLFCLVLAIVLSLGGGALLGKALGAGTWLRSALISAAAHAIWLPLWIGTHNQIVIGWHTPGSTYGFDGLVAFPAAAYAFVVPLIVLFSTFRRNAAKGLAITLPLWIGIFALAVTAVLLGSDGIAVTSGVVAWVVLPAAAVLGLARVGVRTHS